MNGNINIVDIQNYFKVYPLAFDIIFVTDVLIIIDSELRKFDKEQEDLKNSNDKQANQNKTKHTRR